MIRKVKFDYKADGIFSIYPNPAKDIITVDLDSKNTSLVSIFSVDGKLISEKNITQKDNIDIHNLTKGVYLLKVSNNTIGTQTRRFTVFE
jgi:hypothetical protein